MPDFFTDSSLHIWKQALLSKRDLQCPDARSLYRYRLSDGEFNELEALLKTQLYEFSLLTEFGAIATRPPGFPALFVLYAAEWWRRRYNGAHWTWDPILKNIGVNPDTWSQALRSDCVRVGLQDWGLKLRDSGGLRFLGSVAVEGGLPSRLLAEARGGLGQMLSRVLQLAGGRNITQPELLTWVESLQGSLPKSYRQGAIFTLLADVVWTVLCLKDEAGLTSSIDAIETLDQKIGGWRERFPLPLEDGQAKGLIEQLVKDVANVRTERQTVCLPVERSLECSNGTWALRSTLVLPDTIPAKQLAALFAESDEKHLPRMGELTLHVNASLQKTTLRRMAGHDAYRLERKSWGHEKQAAANEHVLKLSAQDGRVWTATAPKGELLDEDLPWIFSTEDANYRLLRQGGGNVAESEVLVAASETWTVRHEVESSADLHGTISGSARCVYRVRGKVIFFDESGQSHKVKTAQAETENENHEWRGDRLWLDFQNPAMTFKGAPHCYRISADGVAHREPGAPGLSLIGASVSSAHLHGPVSLRYPATGEIKYRSRVVLLPKSAMLAMNCKDAQSGELRLKNWAANGVRVLTDGIIGNIHVENTTLILLLSLKPGTQAPENVELEIFWLGNPRPARLTLPFPARGARAFDASGRELPTGSLLAVQQLLGMRLLVLGAQQRQVTLEIQASQGKAMRAHRLQALDDALSIEIRAQDYATDIQHLLSADDNPDSQVTLTLRIGGTACFQVRIARYAAKLDKNAAEVSLNTAGLGVLSSEQLSELPVLALRLERPGDEPTRLIQRFTQDVPTGAWPFLTDTREPGSWLIYPAQDAVLSFRPTRWTIVGGAHTDSPLTRAIGLTNQTARDAALDEAIDAMSSDFLAPCWTELEQLAEQIGHLPLTTLDVWRRFAHCPYGMAALAFRLGTLPGGFLARFSQELPFAWETIPFVAWKQAIETLEAQCKHNIVSEVGVLIFQNHLDSRIKDLSATYGALNYLLGVAKAYWNPKAKIEADILREVIGKTADAVLFDGENSRQMQLRQSHVEETWPDDARPILTQARSQPGALQFLSREKLGYPDGVINLPPLLAAQVATNQTGDWFTRTDYLHILRTHRAFDPDWFDDAYNLTIARCLAAGLLDD